MLLLLLLLGKGRATLSRAATSEQTFSASLVFPWASNNNNNRKCNQNKIEKKEEEEEENQTDRRINRRAQKRENRWPCKVNELGKGFFFCSGVYRH